MKRLLILSGKGGTGKTTTAAAFIHFAQAKAFADCDVDAPNLHLVQEISAQPEKTPFIGGEKARIDPDLCTGCGLCRENCRFDAILDQGDRFEVNPVSCEGCGVCGYVCPVKAISLVPDQAGEQVLYKGSRVFSTAKLKMGRGNSGKLVTNVKMAMLKNAPDCPLAVIDGSPGIGCPVIASISGMDLALIVAEPSKSGLSDLQRLVKAAGTLQTRLAVCVNKYDVSLQNTDRIQAYCQENQIPFVGKMPYDPVASRAINDGRSVAELDCPLRTALYEVYKKTSELLGI